MPKKRKPNLYQQNKIASAQHKNEFLAKTKYIINAATGKNTYELIPKTTLDILYEVKCLPLLIKADDKLKISKDLLKFLKGFIPYYLKQKKVQLYDTAVNITIHDYFSVYLSIYSCRNIINDKIIQNAGKIKEELKIFEDLDTMFNRSLLILLEILNNLSLINLDFHKPMIYFDFDSKMASGGRVNLQCELIIKSINPEIAHLELNKECRPLIRIGFPNGFDKIAWISIKPSDLNVVNTFAQIPHDVYIQSHALNRMNERLDCIDHLMLMNFFQLSLTFKPRMCFDIYKNMMLEFCLGGIKVGYMPFEIMDGKIVIKTFLFITASSTPEGAMLEKYSGLNKAEMKYLGIDKLSTFINSDIDKNKELQVFLRKTGCQNLIDLHIGYRKGFIDTGNSQNLIKMMDLIGKNKDFQKESEMLMNTEA
jgi:hypothetical protein